MLTEPCGHMIGLKDLIRDRQTGFLVDPPDNATAFAERISQLRDDNELRSQIANAGRLDVEHYTWENSMGEVRTLFYAQALVNFEHRLEQRFWKGLKSLVRTEKEKS